MLRIANLGPTILACVVLIASGAHAADWPMYCGHGSYVATVGDQPLVDSPTDVRVLWKNKLHTGFGKGSEKIIRRLAGENVQAFYGGMNSLVVADGVVITSFMRPSGDAFNVHASNRYHKKPAGSDLGDHIKNKIDADDVTVAVDAKTGQTLWEAVEAGKGINMLSAKRGLFGHTPVIAGDRVVVLGSTGMIYCYDLKKGTKLWESNNGKWHEQAIKLKQQAFETKTMVDLYGNKPLDRHFQYRQTDLVVIEDCVIVPNNQRGLIGLNPEDGKRMWEINGVCDLMTTPAPVKIDDQWFLLTNSGKSVSLIDPREGTKLWSIQAGPTTQSLAPNDGHVLLNTRGTKAKGTTDEQEAGLWGCYKLSKTGATQVWTMPFEKAHWVSWMPDRGSDRVALIHQGKVYAKAGADKRTKKFYTLDLATGKILDSDPMIGNCSAPTVVGDFIIADADTSHSASGRLVFYRITDAGVDLLGTMEPKAQGVTGYRTPVQFAVSEGRIYLRSHRGIICYDLRKPAP